MTAEFGVFFLLLALLTSLFQAAFLYPSHRFKNLIAPCLAPAAWLQALYITLALAILITLRLDSDFSVVNVVAHSNLTLPLLYKIVGAWGNHEGSMVLFAWVIAVFAAALAGDRRPETLGLRRIALAVQSLVLSGTLLFILFTSNPFERQFPPPVDGEALNPVLQDIALAMHPPLLYLGYVGFSVIFSLSVAGLLQGCINRDWAKIVHPWILAAWSALTLGIGLGSWWAYRELGWGGWWFWDPVENASLLPWLAATALLHSNIVLEKRGLLAQWVPLLAIVTFGLSLIGTFLVRSGALISVHSFASDPARGFFILLYMTVAIGAGLLVFALYPPASDSSDEMLPVSREGVIVLNNLFLLSACATVLLGTTYPLFAEWISGHKLTVGPPYFNATFLPMMAIPLIFTGLAPLMAWKKASLRSALIQARPALLAALAGGLLSLTIMRHTMVAAVAGFGLAAWLFVSSMQWLLGQSGNWRARLRQGNVLAVFMGHLGVAVLVAGITGVSTGKQEVEKLVAPGDVIEAGGYRLTYKNETQMRKANYEVRRGEFEVTNGRGIYIATLEPEYRAYDIRQTATSEARIHATLFSDLYAVIGESTADGKHRHTAARVYYIPMIRFIWAGFVLMALSGVVSIIQRTRKTLGSPAF